MLRRHRTLDRYRRGRGARCTAGLNVSGVTPTADPGLLPCDGPPLVLAEELVEGLAEQGLERPALGDADQAQLAVDGRGKVAGDGDGAGPAVPGRAGRGGCFAVRAREHAREGVVSLRHFGLPCGGCATTWETEMPETDNPFASVLSRPDSETAASPRPSRHRGPGTIAGHFSPAVHRQLRLLGVMQDRTVQSLLGEALNELFRKHGKLPIARE